MALQHYAVPVERLNDGKPIIAPTTNWWETGVTFNAAAVYLPRSTANDPVIKELLQTDAIDDSLSNGVVAIHYRARPEEDEFLLTRSYIGLAVFTPDFRLLRRFPEPVLQPDDDPTAIDYFGVEDPRITYIDGAYYMVYCGPHSNGRGGINTALCLARSADLVHWEKLGPMRGQVNAYPNKDGVLFPACIGGMYVLLHRPYVAPCNGAPEQKDMHLAISSSLTGEWTDCGKVMSAFYNPACASSWIGAGSVPIPLGNKRYLVIYHVGNYLDDHNREYDLDAAIFDFSHWEITSPKALVTSRMEHFMVPELDEEIKAPSKESVANVLFTCGSYEYDGYIYIVYGAADTYTMVARVPRQKFIDSVAACGTTNPFAG